MQRARARTAATVSIGLTVAVALSACGTPEPSRLPVEDAQAMIHHDTRASAAPLLRDVLAKINEAGSVHSDVQGHLGVVGELRGAGSVRYSDHTDLHLTGHTRMSPDEPPNDVEVTVVDDVSYLKSPLLLPEADKPWLRVSADSADFAAKLLRPALKQLRESTDPRTAFAGLADATKIQSETPDTIDGRPVTRYDLRILLDRAVRTSPDEKRREQLRQARDSGEREIGYQLWVDETGLPVRFAAAPQIAQAGDVSVTTSFHDWAAPVDVQAPPAERVGTVQGMPMTLPPG